MPRLDFELHAWPGHPTPVVADAVRHAACSASRGAGVGPVRVTAHGPFAARVSVGVTANLTGVVTRSIEAALQRLREQITLAEDEAHRAHGEALISR